jgi:SAM-dependent methyltransferase
MEQPRIQVGVDPLYAINDIDLTESRAFNIAGAGESLPFPEASFDTVISNNVLDHTRNPRAVLQEVADVIKDNGRLLLVLNTFELPEFIRRKLRFIDTPHPHHFSTSEIENCSSILVSKSPTLFPSPDLPMTAFDDSLPKENSRKQVERWRK